MANNSVGEEEEEEVVVEAPPSSTLSSMDHHVEQTERLVPMTSREEEEGEMVFAGGGGGGIQDLPTARRCAREELLVPDTGLFVLSMAMAIVGFAILLPVAGRAVMSECPVTQLVEGGDGKRDQLVYTWYDAGSEGQYLVRVPMVVGVMYVLWRGFVYFRLPRYTEMRMRWEGGMHALLNSVLVQTVVFGCGMRCGLDAMMVAIGYAAVCGVWYAGRQVMLTVVLNVIYGGIVVALVVGRAGDGVSGAAVTFLLFALWWPVVQLVLKAWVWGWIAGRRHWVVETVTVVGQVLYYMIMYITAVVVAYKVGRGEL